MKVAILAGGRGPRLQEETGRTPKPKLEVGGQPARFGGLSFFGDMVTRFDEKPQIGEGWINGGFFVLEPGVLDYIDGDRIVFEREPLEALSRDGQLVAYRHQGFWQCMDTLR